MTQGMTTEQGSVENGPKDTGYGPHSSEESVRRILSSEGYVVREEARSSLMERWGAEWPSQLAAAAARVGKNGKAVWHDANGKWILADRQDILILTSDGRVVVAVFEVLPPNVVRDRLVNGEFELSDSVREMITDRLGPEALDDAKARIIDMASVGRVQWRNEPGLLKGGWRLAADGDVFFVNVSANTVTKFQWRKLDSRDMVSLAEVRRALANAGTRDGVRIAEKMRWRLNKAYGSEWEPAFHRLCVRMSHDGNIVPNLDGNGFTATLEGIASMVLSRDAEVAVSVRVSTSGDPEVILGSLRDGTAEVDTAAYDTSSFYRAPARDAWLHLACIAAQDPNATLRATSTHWSLESGTLSVFLSADGKQITGVSASRCTTPEEACAVIRRGAFWTWRSALEAAEIDAVDWYREAEVAHVHETPKGWEWSHPGRPKAKLDWAAGRIVALSRPAGTREAGSEDEATTV